MFTGLIGGMGRTLGLLSKRTEDLRYADNAIDKKLFAFASKFKKEGGEKDVRCVGEKEF